MIKLFASGANVCVRLRAHLQVFAFAFAFAFASFLSESVVFLALNRVSVSSSLVRALEPSAQFEQVRTDRTGKRRVNGRIVRFVLVCAPTMCVLVMQSTGLAKSEFCATNCLLPFRCESLSDDFGCALARSLEPFPVAFCQTRPEVSGLKRILKIARPLDRWLAQ